MFEARNLRFSYHTGNDILKNVSFIAEPGDIIWLQGSNGSGKSTLLRILAQIEESYGEIFYNNQLIESRKLLLSHLTYIPEEPYLFDYLTGVENVHFLQGLFSISENQNREIFKMLSQFELEEALTKLVQEYSLGMRHKLFWSVMFSRQSDIFLLDEPFSAFDTDAQKIAEQVLKDKAKQGAIIIFVSHLEDISLKLATRNFRLEDGELIEIPLSENNIVRS